MLLDNINIEFEIQRTNLNFKPTYNNTRKKDYCI